MALPKWFVPCPTDILPATKNARLEGQQGDRWRRALTMFRDHPPLQSMKAGYVCVAILDEHSRPTGVFKVGLHPRYDKIGLEEEAAACEQDLHTYLEQLATYYDDHILLKSRKKPYIVNLVDHTCTCPDYQERKTPCFHLMGVEYGMAYGQPLINKITGRVNFCMK